ncbi:MAG: hypothetical protein ACP5I8_12525 [Phycisphaerae bacterium]
MDLFQSCLVLAVVSLAPLANYVLRRGQEPFSPLIIVGGLAFVIVCWPPMVNPSPALEYATVSSLIQLEWITTLSLLGLYAGWAYWKKRHRFDPAAWQPSTQYRFDPRRLFVAGAVMAAISLVIYIATYHQYRTIGYILDLPFMRVPAAILLIQALILDPAIMAGAIFWLFVAVAEAVVQFITYGQRGDTIRIALLALVPFLLLNKRPKKIPLLALGAAVAIVVGSLAFTRLLIAKGEANGRVQALEMVAKRMVEMKPMNRYAPGRTYVVGANQIEVVEYLHNWDDGKFLWNIAITFLPHEFFPDKYHYATVWNVTGYLGIIRRTLDVPTPKGMAPTGFVNAFIEFWWLFPAFWFLLGYACRAVYMRAVYQQRIDFQGYLVLLFVCLVYLASQDLYAFSYNAMFTIAPAYLAYRWCRVPVAYSPAAEPYASGLTS